MVAGHHDDLDTGATALSDGVRHGGTGRVDHRHETDESEPGQREVFGVRVERVADRELFLGKVEVTETCVQCDKLLKYSRTCLGRPPLLTSKSGRSRQVVSHNRSDKNHVLPMCTFYTQPGSK